jgi:hypothetical protein
MATLRRPATRLLLVAATLLPIGCASAPGHGAGQTATHNGSTPPALSAAPSIPKVVGVGPTAAPAAQPLPDDLHTPAGEYFLAGDALYGVPPLRISFSVPSDRWRSWGPGILTDEPDARAVVGVSFIGVANVYADSCRWATGGVQDPAVGSTVDELITALAKLPNVTATKPVDVQMAGFPGRYIELAIDDDLRFPDCDRGEVHFWVNSDGGSRYYQGPGQIEQFWVLDVDGTRLMIEGSLFPEASTANRDELQQILDSVAIEP